MLLILFFSEGTTCGRLAIISAHRIRTASMTPIIGSDDVTHIPIGTRVVSSPFSILGLVAAQIRRRRLLHGYRRP